MDLCTPAIEPSNKNRKTATRQSESCFYSLPDESSDESKSDSQSSEEKREAKVASWKLFPFFFLLPPANATCVCSPNNQESKNGGIEEDEKQAENGKKEEDRGREQEGEREADKTDSDTGMSAVMHSSQSVQDVARVLPFSTLVKVLKLGYKKILWEK